MIVSFKSLPAAYEGSSTYSSSPVLAIVRLFSYGYPSWREVGDSLIMVLTNDVERLFIYLLRKKSYSLNKLFAYFLVGSFAVSLLLMCKGFFIYSGSMYHFAQ